MATTYRLGLGAKIHHIRPQKVLSTYVVLKTILDDLTQSITGLILPGAYVQTGE